MNKSISFPKAWLMLGLLLALGLALGNLLGILFISTEVRSAVLSGYADYSNPEVIRQIRLFQGITSTFTFLIPPIIFNFWFRKEHADILGVHPKSSLNAYFLAAVSILVSIPWINGMMAWTEAWQVPDMFQRLQDQNEELLEGFLLLNSRSDLLWNLTVMAFIPALGEEFLFRGVIQPLLGKAFKRAHLAVWLTAFFFAAMHMQIKSFPAMFILGGLLGYLRLYGKNIWMPVIGHYVNNSMMVMASYILMKQGIPLETLDAPGAMEGQWWMVMASFGMMVGSVFLIRALGKENALK